MKTLATILLAGLAGAASVSAGDLDTRLIDAVKQRDAAAVRALIDSGVDVNVADGDGSTALHWAASVGDVAAAEALLKAGASVKASTRIGAITPLLMAARHGNAALVRALLEAGARADEVNANGTTALMLAAAAGSAPAVTLLVDRGADPNAKEATNGQTALMFAAARNSAEAIRVLLQRRADPRIATTVVKLARVRVDANGDPLPVEEKPAANEPAKESADKDPGVGFNKDGQPRRYRDGEERVFGATVIGGMTALHFAAREGHAEAVRALVDGGAGVNLVTGGEKTSPIVEAIINGHMDIAKFLLDRGADPTLANVDGLTPLYAAVDMRWRHNTWYPQPTIEEEKTNYLDFMNALIDRGADVNARVLRKLWFRKFRYGDDWVEPIGATAFWRAAQANDVDAMHYTTLHGAAYVGDNATITYLVSKGADIKARAKGRLGGTQGAEDVPEGMGDTSADMANGPREKSLLHPGTVKLVEGLGSENSHDCRSTACVNNTKTEKPAAPKP